MSILISIIISLGIFIILRIFKISELKNILNNVIEKKENDKENFLNECADIKSKTNESLNDISSNKPKVELKTLNYFESVYKALGVDEQKDCNLSTIVLDNNRLSNVFENIYINYIYNLVFTKEDGSSAKIKIFIPKIIYEEVVDYFSNTAISKKATEISYITATNFDIERINNLILDESLTLSVECLGYYEPPYSFDELLKD